MGSKEIKTHLKAAREAIRIKDYKEALKECKAVLAADKSNYNALVFFGVAAEGMDQPEQALGAYRKAAEECPDQMLAWQGLSSLLEKNPTLVPAEEAITVFEKLVSINTNDAAKQVLFLHKLADIYIKVKETDKAVETLANILNLDKESGDRIKALYSLISLLEPSAPGLDARRLDLYKTSLEEILSSPLMPEEIHEYTGQLLLLTSQVQLNDLEVVSDGLKTKFPTATPPLEYLLRQHLDRNIVRIARIAGNDCPAKDSCDQIQALTTQLGDLKEGHAIVKIGQCFINLQDKKFIQARDCLQDIPTEYISGQYYLSQACLGLHSHQQCLEACERGLAACKSSQCILCAPCADVVVLFKLTQAEVYRELGTKEAQDCAMALLEQIQEQKPNEAFLIKAYLYLDQGEIENAQSCLTHLALDAVPVQTLKAAILFVKKAFKEALKMLQETLKAEPADARCTLLLGKILWEHRDAKEIEAAKQECFTTLLKAAKLDPYNYESFLYLGYFYKEVQGDLIKARRCFQKAYDLSPGGEIQGSALVDTLVELGEESQSLKILETVTSQAPAGRARWAWLRLGLYQIKHEDPTTAITSLQSALRADPNDNHVWECLAEAYLQRGSLTASLKAFTKASELDPDSLYCQYQIASIKHTLGSLSEAIQEYKQILEKSHNYVPVLKGVGESLIQLGKLHLSRCLDGLAHDCFEEAIGYLTRAASQRPDLSCLWKLMGDACTMTHSLSSDSYSIPSKLVSKTSQEHDCKKVSKVELLQVGARCYSQAVKIFTESGSLWHDLAVNLYHQSQQVTDKAEKVALLQRAAHAIKKSISVEPGDWRHWNVLGVIACDKNDHKPTLAQHCFIKSIQSEASNVSAWTNLATLYLSKGDIQLAHDAFKAAQSVDPTYIACWIGQALIAEVVGHEEAMDLFRHTTELGYHPESAIGYGQWVLSVLGDSTKKDSELFQYAIHQMAAVPAASDALIRYTGRIKTDPVAYNMLGLLYEHQNLLQSAVSALEKALKFEETDSTQNINDVRLNLARVLCKQGKYEESARQFEQCDLSVSVEHICVYGLALFRCNRPADCIKAYQHALELTIASPAASEVHTALGMVAYQLGDMATAKSQLFDGFQTSHPSPYGLMALCTLGLLQQDMTLASAVLDELFKRDDRDKYLKDIALLQICKLTLENEKEKGEALIREMIEAHPSNSSLWSLLASFFLIEVTDKTTAVLECAQAALSIKEAGSQSHHQQERLLQTLGQLLSGHHNRHLKDANAFKSAQRAFRANPGCTSTMSALACAVRAEAIIRRALNSESDLFRFENGLLTILLESEISADLERWCLQQLIVNCIEGNDVASAKAALNQLLGKNPLSPDAEQFAKSVSMFLSSQLNETSVPGKLSELVDCALHIHKEKYEEAIKLLEHCIQCTEMGKSEGIVKSLQERLAYTAYSGLQEQPENTGLKNSFENIAKYLKDKEKQSSIISLLQALLAFKDNKRLAKHHFATALDQVDSNTELGYCSSVVRQALVKLLCESTKESDQQLIKALIDDAKAQGDTLTSQMYENLCGNK